MRTEGVICTIRISSSRLVSFCRPPAFSVRYVKAPQRNGPSTSISAVTSPQTRSIFERQLRKCSRQVTCDEDNRWWCGRSAKVDRPLMQPTNILTARRFCRDRAAQYCVNLRVNISALIAVRLGCFAVATDGSFCDATDCFCRLKGQKDGAGFVLEQYSQGNSERERMK